MQIEFYGAAEMVTGSKHLLKLDNGKQILLDCGMFQGRGRATDEMNRHFGFAPHEVDYLILSHAHIDHSGLIPLLVKEGFSGRILTTSATKDLCEIMLTDSAHIQEDDAKYLNKKLLKRGKKTVDALYTQADVPAALSLFESVPYNVPFQIDEDLSLLFTDAGHILGSACVNLTITENGKQHQLAFTGDIGRFHSRILRAPQPFPQADYIICESTYGDREHEYFESSDEEFLKVVLHTCVEKQGKLIIPAFSLGRTQEIVNILNNLEHEGKLPRLKVFVDSPLSMNATNIMRKHPECFNKEVLDYMKSDPTPFGFDNLTYIQNVQESIALNELEGPCIIISASGMLEAGRIKHHVKNNIDKPSTTIMIVGWCTPQSLGGRIRSGEQYVKIFGDTYRVNAEVVVMNPFSAHADYNEMLQYLSCQDASKVKQLFLVHGDVDVLPKWAKRLEEAGFNNIEIPKFKASYKLN